jgi:hypothetical protein
MADGGYVVQGACWWNMTESGIVLSHIRRKEKKYYLLLQMPPAARLLRVGLQNIPQASTYNFTALCQKQNTPTAVL